MTKKEIKEGTVFEYSLKFANKEEVPVFTAYITKVGKEQVEFLILKKPYYFLKADSGDIETVDKDSEFWKFCKKIK